MQKRVVVVVVSTIVGLAALVLSPQMLVIRALIPMPEFGAAEVRAAVEGDWKLSYTAWGDEPVELTFRMVQGAKPRARQTRLGLIRSAAACGHRSLVRAAEACFETTDMPVEVTLVAATGSHSIGAGRFEILRNHFTTGSLTLTLDGSKLTAQISSLGEASGVEFSNVRVHHPATLVRISR